MKLLLIRVYHFTLLILIGIKPRKLSANWRNEGEIFYLTDLSEEIFTSERYDTFDIIIAQTTKSQNDNFPELVRDHYSNPMVNPTRGHEMKIPKS